MASVPGSQVTRDLLAKLPCQVLRYVQVLVLNYIEDYSVPSALSQNEQL